MTLQDSTTLQESTNSLLAVRDFKAIRQLFKSQQSADLADILTQGELTRTMVLYRLVSRQKKAEIFSYLPSEIQQDLLEALPDVIVASVVNEMEPDDRTRLLESLPPEIQRRVLSQLDPDERRVAWRLLSYPENSVGRLMTPEFLSLRSAMTVSQAMDYIRWSSIVPVDHLHTLFVTEPDGRLVGEVGLATLVVADPPSLKLIDLMNPTPVALLPTQESTDAVEAFRKYDRPQMPVVDEDRFIIGIVTADDVFDVAEEEATEDIQQFGGQGALEDSYFLTPIMTMIRKRAGWLAVLFVGQMFTGTALRHYEEVLSTMGFLIFFLPLVVSSGGNSGTQSASLILRAIAIKEISHGDWLRVLKRESIIGICLGTFLGILGFARAKFWGYDGSTGIAVCTTLICVVAWGAIVGSLLPLLIRKARLDPAVVSSPFISTLVDVTGIIIFINVSIYLLHHVIPGL